MSAILKRDEKDKLGALQQRLGRRESRCAAVIPIRKTDAWWQLPQGERRLLLETRSCHIAIVAVYLPAIARRPCHCRDIGGDSDLLTWFEFSERDAAAFDEFLGRPHETEEWRFVEREIEIRMRGNQ